MSDLISTEVTCLSPGLRLQTSSSGTRQNLATAAARQRLAPVVVGPGLCSRVAAMQPVKSRAACRNMTPSGTRY